MSHGRAVAIGVVGPPAPLTESLEPVLPPLEGADDAAAALAAELVAFGYDVGPTAPPATASDLQAAVDGVVLDEAAGPVVVHVASHGIPGKEASKLFVRGPDGVVPRLPVNQWVTDAVERAGDGPVLFVLDLCYSGRAVEDQLKHVVRAGTNKAWVLSATTGGDPAYDLRLTRALTTVLAGYRSGALRVDPSVPFIPLRAVCQATARAVHDLSTGRHPQEVDSTWVPLHFTDDALGFFPNPGYAPEADVRHGLDRSLIAQLDEAFDPSHFLGRAAATQSVGGALTVGHFHGRHAQLRALEEWATGAGPAVRVVTGKPGVGKSALLGIFTVAAHHALRDRTQGLWNHLPAPPRMTGGLAVVHARRRTTGDVCAALARQWSLGDDVTTTAILLDRLTTAPGQTAGPVSAVVDAVDEASDPDLLMRALLLPLAQARDENGHPRCRLLVGVRPEPRFTPLLDAAGDGLVDLGLVPRGELRDAVRAHVHGLLRGAPGYDDTDHIDACRVLADTIADRLCGTRDDNPDSPHHPDEPSDQEWGEFLVAGLYVRYLLDQPTVADPDQARTLGGAVPQDLHGVLHLDLTRSPGSHSTDTRDATGDQPDDDVPGGVPGDVVRAVATALAFAEGAGMPEQVVRAVASAVLDTDHTGSASTMSGPSGSQSEGLDLDAVRAALRRLRFYLRRDVDVDGSTLYRLFHQGLADQLRHEGLTHAPDGTLPGVDHQVEGSGNELLQRIWARIEEHRRNAGIPWSLADPYVLRHAAQHASAAGQLGGLVQNADFLRHADPPHLARALDALPGVAGGGAPATYRASYVRHVLASPDQRAQILAVDAAGLKREDLAIALSSDAP